MDKFKIMDIRELLASKVISLVLVSQVNRKHNLTTKVNKATIFMDLLNQLINYLKWKTFMWMMICWEMIM